MTQLLEPHAGVRPRTSPTAASPETARRSRSTLYVFVTACVAYLVAGWQLAIKHHLIMGDAMARVANASYVIFSRDPHLAAVGFVWNPLPSFATLPFLAVSPWFPELRTQAFASNIVSAIFMAGSVAVIWQILRELRIATVAMIALTTLYAIHPIILEYGANGASEATLVFFLALSCLGLMRWLDRRDLNSLLLIGAALAFGYLSRQELLAAGGASIALILIVTYLDARG
ncbi:MAG: glycosyltransferase family 39 protein, partial [Acidimicrobiia bacterium]